jgi:SAM-dependent methyltransferase
MKEKYFNIIDHYASKTAEHGDSHLGMDWPNFDDAQKRYGVMVDVFDYDRHRPNSTATLLDFGCGSGHLLEYINVHSSKNQWEYHGLELSKPAIDLFKSKFRDVPLYDIDILKSDLDSKFDYIIMNGIFTEKVNLSWDEMWVYFNKLLTRAFEHCKRGVAFNVMSKVVDWEREDLFHLDKHQLDKFLCTDLSRNFIIRNDYGLYEYTVYVYK